MIFVSYSRIDIMRVRAVVKALTAKGMECWLDESNIPVGQAFVERLGIALRKADCFLLVDTPASRLSYWVSRELLTSSRYRREGRYRCAIRLYSSECECTDEDRWDFSVPFGRLESHRIAKFLATLPSVGSKLLKPEGEHEGVSFINDTGLGQPSNWTGRQDELRALDEWWLGAGPGVWLSGLGGSGKSGLLQTWVTALSDLGYAEAVSADVAYFRAADLVAERVQHAFFEGDQEHRRHPKLLLVDGHDEARSTVDIEQALLQALHWGVRTLVTSRGAVPERLSEYFTNVSLATMTRRDSVALLNQFGILGSESDKLAAELGDHPLALLVLSHSFATGKRTATELLADLRRARDELSDSSGPTLQSIRATLRTSVHNLESDARSLLQTLCRVQEHEVAIAELSLSAVRELASAGLVQIDHFETPSQLSVHPLVREFIREEHGNSVDL